MRRLHLDCSKLERVFEFATHHSVMMARGPWFVQMHGKSDEKTKSDAKGTSVLVMPTATDA
jgi:hypothetical protein